MAESLPKNFIDYEEYPQSAEIQNRCVSMIARLFNARECLRLWERQKISDDSILATHDETDHAMGTSCVGSSEAIMLGTLAMKKRWRNKRKAEGKDFHNPNIIMNSAVQVCWEKAARYFDIEERYVFCTDQRYVLDPEEAVKLIDENTIGICAILGTTYTGEYEDVKRLNDILVRNRIDCPIHVDAASGGFVAPFVYPSLEWDFRLEKVVSINVSGHKYGLGKYRTILRGTVRDTQQYILEWAGSSGAHLNSSPKSLSSTSTIWELIRHLSPLIFRRAQVRSLVNTIR
jgi:glutamate decarboxylase